MQSSPEMRFNPTATAVYCTGPNHQQIQEVMGRCTGKPYTDPVVSGKYYVAFMGDVYVMDEQQFRAAQGFV